MTKVLLISNKSDLTCDFIVKKLKERNVSFYRFNTEELTKSVSIAIDYKLETYHLSDTNRAGVIDLRTFTSVYFRRPEMPSIDISDLSLGEIDFIKNEIMYTLEGIYKILRNAYWISPLYAIREAENKIYQLELGKSLGFQIPDTFIGNDYNLAASFFERTEKKCIVKPIKSGLIHDEESSVVFTSIVSEFPDDKNKIESAPHYFQKCIEKQGDIRVTMVGENVFGALIHSQEFFNTKIDWRRGEMSLEHTKIDIPKDIKDKCILLLRKLNLRFGAIDFVLDENGNYIFLEINPNGQWAWIEKQTGYEISNEIVNLLVYESF